MRPLFQHGTPVTAVQRNFYASPSRKWLARLLCLVLIVGLLTLMFLAYAAWQISRTYSHEYSDIDKHFRFGSIGSEQSSGLPIKLLQTLPGVFPEYFGEEKDYSHFGFLRDPNAPEPKLPIGFSQGRRFGVEVAWINCAACHTGQVQIGDAAPQLISGMPANTVRLHEFFLALFEMAADKRFNPGEILPEIEKTTGELGWFEKMAFKLVAIPQVQQELIDRRSRLKRVFGEQPDWGPGRVDTFSGYKMIHLDYPYAKLEDSEKIGASDFPAIFLQGVKGEKQFDLHWDGNNKSLNERNLSAALGAGVTEETVLHHSIERLANWLKDLEPPPSPHPVNAKLAEKGAKIYQQYCQDCHGYNGPDGYVFEGEKIGQVTPIDEIGTDVSRLNSYTSRLAEEQKQFFAYDRDHAFRFFKKTNGYANTPLDGLWLRAPYLHNGSVPTLYDLLRPANERPTSFVRGLIAIDSDKGGFVAPTGCKPYEKLETGFCFSTTDSTGELIRGNQNIGHEYATHITEQEKTALLEYLKGF